MGINYKSLGKRIRSFRKSSGITQRELGEISGVEASNISHIERAATKVSLPTLVKIADGLNVSLDDLVYESIKSNRHISVKELNETLSDCTEIETKILVEIVRFSKDILRKTNE